MADDALPQTIRHALGTAFKKKPADTLDQWAALCAKAGMDDVDDVASCHAEDSSTWLHSLLPRLATPHAAALIDLRFPDMCKGVNV